ncbi:hypothetical protein [Paractinoplanes rishiriensis]|uniref:hypothetical protein n=1 Tax=Paractinoplanes rishiriensis TaxID=1050105 RepID=UPI0019433A8F|nr:hypothetical protein [Actinoplanes rishiriensis]
MDPDTGGGEGWRGDRDEGEVTGDPEGGGVDPDGAGGECDSDDSTSPETVTTLRPMELPGDRYAKAVGPAAVATTLAAARTTIQPARRAFLGTRVISYLSSIHDATAVYRTLIVLFRQAVWSKSGLLRNSIFPPCQSPIPATPGIGLPSAVKNCPELGTASVRKKFTPGAMLQAGLVGRMPVIVTLILAIEILYEFSLMISPDRSTGWSSVRTMGLGPAISTAWIGPPVDTAPLPVAESGLIHA